MPTWFWVGPDGESKVLPDDGKRTTALRKAGTGQGWTLKAPAARGSAARTHPLPDVPSHAEAEVDELLGQLRDSGAKNEARKNRPPAWDGAGSRGRRVDAQTQPPRHGVSGGCLLSALPRGARATAVTA